MQVDNLIKLIAFYLATAILLVFLTWLSLFLSQVKLIKMVVFLLPLFFVPLITGLISGFFIINKRSYIMYIPAALTYGILTITTTISALINHEKSLLIAIWIFLPFVILITGSFMTLGVHISKLIYKRIEDGT